MAEATNTSSSEIGLFCPNCQYNLRGLASGRCPECGREFDVAQLSTSRVPWLHRREIGRFRAWWRTCWMALWRPGEIAASLNAPHCYADARRFWLVNVVIVWLPLAVACFCYLLEITTAPLTISTLMRGTTPTFWLEVNASVPWTAAAIFPGIMAGCFLLFLLAATGGVSYLFQFIPGAPRQQDRAAALSLYTSGVLIAAFVPVTALATLLMVAQFVTPGAWADPGNRIVLTYGGVPLVVVVTWWFCIGRLYRRMSQSGLLRSAIVAVLLPVSTLLSAVITLGFLPWCIGVLRVIWYSVQS
jgi:hypothetical protein